MILSVSIILLSGLLLGSLFSKLKLPKLLGMIIAGMVIGPYCMNLLDNSILSISAQIRQIALIIILTRAGLSLNIDDLKKVGRPALLMCFVPAIFEMCATVFLAPKLFNISTIDACILASVIAAVSPAVVVPKMIELMDNKLGTDKGIPQMILAGASVDDVFVIVMFSCFTSLATGSSFDFMQLVQVPLSIIDGIVIGFMTGFVLSKVFKKIKGDSNFYFIVSLSFSFILMELESILKIPFSGYISIMAMGLAINQKSEKECVQLNHIYSQIWNIAQIFLFVLVGASVNLTVALNAGINSVVLILFILVIRMIGVLCCLIKTNLNKKERIYTAISYMPKATVQAAMGGVPLALGFACGDLILAISVISILISAPIGAILMDKLDEKCLSSQ
ncbi:cation:proton antiporter [Floccifex sp.]|uniref:cation:proton antiporter n=1 Tax=Floccifex sp. TaxID=2815810 RepID=UPI002A74EB30|nr:cation:proton antiporter [Floccifex sp.]MDD7281880.1 cation:proton antiporter [Erysipelotrichaceae bacterium]MDY2958609.1 cation:proton antiporter [Floccifex sp.]